MSFFAELKRRNVFKVGAAYLALAWVVVQATGAIVPALNLPATLLPTVVWIGVIGFPCAIIFSWVYELTPEGLKRESELDRSQSITQLTSKRLDYIIIAMLAVAIGLFLLQYFRPPAAAPVATSDTAVTPAPPSAEAAAPARVVTSPVLQSAAVAPDDKSIAVLPFADMSPQKDQEYMSDGIAEELLNLLVKAPELKVIARTSSFAFKGTNTSIVEIAKQLNVAHVLEGSVRKAGNTVRITAQLIRTADSTHLWSETYDRPLDDVFAVQDEIAGAVVTQLKIRLLGAAPESRAVDPRAYALFLQGRQLSLRAEDYRRSNELYQQALALDGSYVAPWVGLARNYIGWSSDELTPDERFQRARESLAKALALVPDHAPALAPLAIIEILDSSDFAAAARLLSRAKAREPDNGEVLEDAAFLLRRLGRMDQAVALGEYLAVRDPLNTFAHYDLGNAYRYAGRLDEAIAAYRVALRLAPSAVGVHDKITGVLLQQGKAEAALVEIQQEPNEARRLTMLPLVYDALGRSAEADVALAALTGQHAALKAFAIAGIYAARGDADAAFEWLEKDAQSGGQDIGALPVYPDFAPLHADARWLPFLQKLGLAPEQLAAVEFEVQLPQQ